MPRPFVPISHGIEVALKAHAAGRMSPAVMTFGFRAVAATPDDADLAAVAVFFGNWLTGAYGGIPASVVYFDAFVVKSLAARPAPKLTFSVGGFATGGTGRFAVFAPLTILTSGSDSRSENGRSFSFMPPDDSLGDLGEFDPDYIGTVQSAQLTLISNAGTAGYPRAVPSALLGEMTPLTDCNTQLKYSYQTRRDPNRG